MNHHYELTDTMRQLEELNEALRKLPVAIDELNKSYHDVADRMGEIIADIEKKAGL